MPYEPSGAVPTSTVTSVTNWAPVCTVPGQPRAACAAWLGAGMNAVATLASAMLAHCNERDGFLRPPFTIAICPRGGGILPEASREGRAPEIVFITRLAKDRMTMDQPHPGRRRDDENPGMSSSGCRTLENDATQARSQEKSLPREKFPPSSRRRRPIAGRRVRIKIRSRLLLNQVYFAWRSSMGHTCSCWVAADESAGSLGVKCSRQKHFLVALPARRRGAAIVLAFSAA